MPRRRKPTGAAYGHAPGDDVGERSRGPAPDRASTDQGIETLPPPGENHRVGKAKQHNRQYCPETSLKEAFCDERSADEGERRSDQFHDLELLAPCVEAEPD